MNTYEKDMHIQEDALDFMCLEQPALTVKYSRMLAEARQTRDQAKEALDLVRAELDLQIRDNPEKFKLPKVTEGSIASAILMNKRYQQAQKTLNDANFEVNVLQGVSNAIDHRKSMLEGLIKLHGQQYFAGPRVPHDLSEMRKKREEHISTGINKHLKRTRHGKEE